MCFWYVFAVLYCGRVIVLHRLNSRTCCIATTAGYRGCQMTLPYPSMRVSLSFDFQQLFALAEIGSRKV